MEDLIYLFYLSKWIKIDLVEYICPINDKNNKRKSGYRIKNLSLRFYYNYNIQE